MKTLYLKIRRWFLSLFMLYGKDEPTHLTEEVEVEWTAGHSWGYYHPDNLHQWWSKDHSDRIIKNTVYYNRRPKEFEINGETKTLDWEMGVRRSVTKFTRGFFKFEVNRTEIRKGTGDAIWLSGAVSWPPEIDIVEWYGARAESNFHINKPKHSVGAKRHKPAKVYSCWWEKDFIRIYYDGFLVREYKKMRYYNEPMGVIINTSCSSKLQVSHRILVIPKIYI